MATQQLFSQTGRARQGGLHHIFLVSFPDMGVALTRISPVMGVEVRELARMSSAGSILVRRSCMSTLLWPEKGEWSSGAGERKLKLRLHQQSTPAYQIVKHPSPALLNSREARDTIYTRPSEPLYGSASNMSEIFVANLVFAELKQRLLSSHG